MNNIRKQYLSDYYIVVYGRNELDLENTTINVASEINKCGLNTKLLGRKETAIFLKYSFSRNFDEREIKEIDDNRLIAWVKPKKLSSEPTVIRWTERKRRYLQSRIIR